MCVSEWPDKEKEGAREKEEDREKEERGEREERKREKFKKKKIREEKEREKGGRKKTYFINFIIKNHIFHIFPQKLHIKYDSPRIPAVSRNMQKFPYCSK